MPALLVPASPLKVYYCMKFSQRSYQLELIDGEVPFDDLKVNLDELHVINRWLGGYAISTSALRQIKHEITGLADIGCGGGHFLLAFRKAFPEAELFGIDIKSECIAYAQEVCQGKLVNFIEDDYRRVLDLPQVNVIHACLFFHHFKEEDIVEFLTQVRHSGKSLIINDLERNRMAYDGIKILSSLFSRSYLVKNDAPLSVQRGFKKREWRRMMEQAGIKDFQIKNRWAFRHQIIVHGKV